MSKIFLETKQVRNILNQWNADIASKVPGKFFQQPIHLSRIIEIFPWLRKNQIIKINLIF